MITTSALSLAVIVFGLAAWLIKRGLVKHDDPLEQHRKRIEQARRDVASGTDADVSTHGHDDLRELDRLRASRGDRAPK